jgi:N utilization substance protein A
MRVKAVITDVSDSTKGPAIVVSRRSPELIKKLFEMEVPEIADKLVEIVGVAREPGYRSKIAVISHADGVDPVGACVGPRGSRVRMVVSELRGEKIDIIPHNDEPGRFVAKALSPARVREVIVDDQERQATVIVPDDQLSLAIGRDGQNARLAARLTGWRVDIKSETEFAQDDEEIEYEGEEQADGRCLAVLSNGRRCPNAAISDSSYCGLPQHQALRRFETNQIAVLASLSEAEVAILADPDADEAQVAQAVGKAEAEFEEPAEEEPEAEASDDDSSGDAPAGPDAAGDPPPPAVAEASSGAVPPTAPPADEASEEASPEGRAIEDSATDSDSEQEQEEAVEESEEEVEPGEEEDDTEAESSDEGSSPPADEAPDEAPADPGREAEESADDGEAASPSEEESQSDSSTTSEGEENATPKVIEEAEQA